MLEELNIPIYRAKKIDSDEYFEGCYVKGNSYKGLIHWIYTGGYYVEKLDNSMNDNREEIDPSTLEISFDNGETWRSMSDIEIALKLLDKFLE